MKRSEIKFGVEVAAWGRDYNITKNDVMVGRKAIHGMILGPPQRKLYRAWNGTAISSNLGVNENYGEEVARIPLLHTGQFSHHVEPIDEVWDQHTLVPVTNVCPWEWFLQAGEESRAMVVERRVVEGQMRDCRAEMLAIVTPSVHRLIPPRPSYTPSIREYGMPALIVSPVPNEPSRTMGLATVQHVLSKRNFLRYSNLHDKVRELIREKERLDQAIRASQYKR